jgi:hypothetical protein
MQHFFRPVIEQKKNEWMPRLPIAFPDVDEIQKLK